MGSCLGTGENSFPQAEYWGTLLLSPPEWMTRIRRPLNKPAGSADGSCSAIYLRTLKVAPPEPTRLPSGSGSTA